ncbi:hypothetical protein cyc_03308 [Cyclospora cayetanensis]|uniref:Uncharacterized protein n=1 Tax=Cyclospora cayetanensis TaxID=88456 RepID=A0A1D3D4X2_9EIME|nr:hypothetical protein cyc_03308 [Cyclospora cayetanensis]
MEASFTGESHQPRAAAKTSCWKREDRIFQHAGQGSEKAAKYSVISPKQHLEAFSFGLVQMRRLLWGFQASINFGQGEREQEVAAGVAHPLGSFGYFQEINNN